ncbi:hypothetical protein MMC17_004236 [Xylographa soralifera]|nr:hypothetical protein [Xylographa soralifera]
MEGDQPGDDGGDDGEIRGRKSPTPMEIDTTVLPSASDLFSLQDIQEALTAAWSGQRSDVPLVRAVHHFLPQLQYVVSAAESNTHLEAENQCLEKQATDALIGRYVGGEYETVPQAAIIRLHSHRKELEQKLESAENANRDKDQQIATFSAMFGDPDEAINEGLSAFGEKSESGSPSKSESPVESEKKKGKRRAREDRPEPEGDIFGDQPSETDEDDNETPTRKKTTPKKESTPKKQPITPTKGTKADKPGTGDEEAGSSISASMQAPVAPKGKKKSTAGSEAAERSKNIAQLEKQKKRLQRQQKEADDRKVKAELGKQIGQLGKDIKRLQETATEELLQVQLGEETAAEGSEVQESGEDPEIGEDSGKKKYSKKYLKKKLEKCHARTKRLKAKIASLKEERDELKANQPMGKNSDEDIDSEAAKIAKLTADLQACRDENQRRKSELETLQAQVFGEDPMDLGLSDQIRDLREEISTLQEDYARKEQELNAHHELAKQQLQEELKNHYEGIYQEKFNKWIETDYDPKVQDLEKKSRMIEKLEEQKKDLERQLREEEARVYNLKRDIERKKGEMERHIAESNNDYEYQMNKNTELRTENADLLRKTKKPEMASRSTQTEDDTAQRLEDCERRHSALEATHEDLVAKNKDYEERYAALSTTNTQIVKDLEECRTTLSTTQTQSRQKSEENLDARRILAERLDECSKSIDECEKARETLKTENNRLTAINSEFLQDVMLEGQVKDQIEKDLETCEENRKALKEENNRLAEENAGLKRRAEIPLIVPIGIRTEVEDLQNAAKNDVKPLEDDAEEMARSKAENETSEGQIRTLEAELHQAQEAIGKNDADVEDEDGAIYTKDELNEIAKTHSEIFKTNAEDMAKCIAENKAYTDRILVLEAELRRAQETVESLEESAAKTDDASENIEASTGDIADAEVQQKETESGNNSYDATPPDARSYEVQALLNANADLKFKLADCEANGRTLQSQVDELKTQLETTEVDSKQEKQDLERRIADLEGQLNESHTEVASLKRKVKEREEDIDRFSHDNTDLVRRLAYSESGARRPEARTAFELAVEVEVARRLAVKPSLISQLSDRIQEVKEAYAKVIKSIQEHEDSEATVLEIINEHQNKINALEAYLERGPQFSNARAPNLENTGIDQSAELAEMTAELEVANETNNRLSRQVDELREQNKRLGQDKTDIEEERDRLQKELANARNALEQCQSEKLQLQSATHKTPQKVSESLSDDLARCNEERDRLSNELANVTTALEQCQSEKRQLQSATHENQKLLKDFRDDLARCNEERDRLKNELTNANDKLTKTKNELATALADLERCRQEHNSLEQRLRRAKTPQNVPEDLSRDMARSNEERDRLRNELRNARADLDRCRQDLQRLETRLALSENQPRRSPENNDVQNQTAGPSAPDPPKTPADELTDELTRCMIENRGLKEQLRRANLQIQGLQRAENASNTRANLARLESQFALSDAQIRRLDTELASTATSNTNARQALQPLRQLVHERNAHIAQLHADLQAAHADFADLQNLNTYLQDRLGQLLREIFRTLQQHLGLAPPSIESHNLDDTEPWLRGLADRLAAQAQQVSQAPPRAGAPQPLATLPGRAVGTTPRARFSFLPGRSSCPACEALAAAVGDLDQTYVVRRTDFDAARAQVDAIVWGLEDRVRGLEGLVRRLEDRNRGLRRVAREAGVEVGGDGDG